MQKVFQEDSKLGCTRMKEEKKNALESENSSIWYDGVYIRRALSNYYIVQIFESPLFDIKMASTGQRSACHCECGPPASRDI